MGALITERVGASAYLVSEANGYRSRETIKVANTTTKSAGAVLGKVTATELYDTYNPANTDGTQTVAAILYDWVDAVAGGAGVPRAAHVRDCEVRGADLVWFAGATPAQIATGTTALAALGIISR